MRKKVFSIAPLAIASLAIALGMAPASAAPIVRHPNPPPAIILAGVTIPPHAELILLSGQLASPIDPAGTGDMAYGDTRTQAISTLNKIKAELGKHGYAMSDVVKLTAFLVGDPKLGGKMDFAGWNEAYKLFFGSTENPDFVARSTVQVVALAGPQFLVEIEAIAAKAPKSD